MIPIFMFLKIGLNIYTVKLVPYAAAQTNSCQIISKGLKFLRGMKDISYKSPWSLDWWEKTFLWEKVWWRLVSIYQVSP